MDAQQELKLGRERFYSCKLYRDFNIIEVKLVYFLVEKCVQNFHCKLINSKQELNFKISRDSKIKF